MVTAVVTTFNVNQFSTPVHQRADLTSRMKDSDVVLCQETVGLDLASFTKGFTGWAAFQVRNGADDGHANTAVLYRAKLGKPTATDSVLIGDAADTRDRYLTAVELGGVWFWSAHIFPERDASVVSAELAAIAAWVKAHKGPQCGGLDRNKVPAATLARVTGLTWHGIKIDGLLNNLPTTKVAEFPKGFSDHPGVHGTVTLPVAKPTRVEQATDLLGDALKAAVANGRQEKAGRIRKALHALSPAKSVPRKTFPAIAAARNQSGAGPRFGVGLCLQRVRLCYRIGPAANDAIGAWDAAKVKHLSTAARVPRGYPIFWRGGSAGHGHIAISAGNGKCWSTDIKRPGFFDLVPIDLIRTEWGLTFLGYTEDLNGTPIKA